MKKNTLLLLPCFCMTMPLLTATPHVPHAPHDAHATHEVHATHATHAVAKGYHEAGVSKAHTVKGPKNTEAIEATEAKPDAIEAKSSAIEATEVESKGDQKTKVEVMAEVKGRAERAKHNIPVNVKTDVKTDVKIDAQQKADVVKSQAKTELTEATEATEAKSGVSEKAQDIKNSHEIQGTPMENVKTAPRAKADI